MKNNKLRLSHPQKRIQSLVEEYPDSSMFNLGGYVEVLGPIVEKKLEKAINIFIQRNDGMRINIIKDEKEAFQFIREYKYEEFERKEFSSEREGEFEAAAEIYLKKAIDIKADRLYDFMIFTKDKKSVGYFLKLHHLISDGWSFSLLTKEIALIYEQLAEDKPICLEPAVSYVDYLDNEEKYKNSSRFEKDKSYWMNLFSETEKSEFSINDKRIRGARLTHKIDIEISEKINHFIEEKKLTINAFFSGILVLYIFCKTQQEQIIIGNPVFNRSGRKERKMIGMFTSNMPLKVTVDREQKLDDFLVNIVKVMGEALRHQKYPYDILAKNVDLAKKGIPSLFDYCLNYYNTQLNDEIDGYSVNNKEIYNGEQDFSVQLVVTECNTSHSFNVHVDYKLSKFNQREAENFWFDYYYLLSIVLESSNDLVGNVFQKFEQRTIVQKKSFQPKQVVDFVDKFELNVKHKPNKVAVIVSGETITYEELNTQINQMANLLIRTMDGKKGTIAIILDNSVEVIIAILSCLKVNIPYIPISDRYVYKKTVKSLKTAQCELVITNRKIDQQLFINTKKIFIEDKEWVNESQQLTRSSKKADAYVIFTSGTTGDPKGVQITRENLNNYVNWASDKYIENENEVFAFYSPISFDLTVTSIFIPLFSGTSIKIFNNKYSIVDIFKDCDVSIVKATPAHLELITDSVLQKSNIDKLVIGGEDLKTIVAKRVYQNTQKNVKIYNEYGPTETTVGCMIHLYDPKKDNQATVPIGKAIDNMEVLILNSNKQITGTGEIGSIYIGGLSVFRGYVSNENASNNCCDLINGTKFYKSGDLGRYLDNSGTVEFLGRQDHQLKINGFRVEPKEIEEVLLKIEGVSQAFVTGKNLTDGKQLIHAYLIVDHSICTEEQVIRPASKLLPYYMIPTYIDFVPEFPLSPNGKINRNELNKISKKKDPQKQINTGNEMAIQKKIQSVFQKVLNQPSYNEKNNFFESGGDSIKALEVVHELKALDIQTETRSIFEYPTIYELQKSGIHFISSQTAGEIEDGREIQKLPILEWFFQQEFINPFSYTQGLFFNIEDSISVESLKESIRVFLNSYAAFKLQFNYAQKRVWFDLGQKHTVRVKTTDIPRAEYPFYDELNALRDTIAASKQNLIKCEIVLFSNNEKYVLIAAHHLLVDGVSWRLICKEIDRILSFSDETKYRKIYALESYGDWSIAVNQQYEKMKIKNSYIKYLEGSATQAAILKEQYGIKQNSVVNSLENIIINLKEIEYVEEHLKLKAVTLEKILILSFAQVLNQSIQNQEIFIEVEKHGRQVPATMSRNLENGIGWHTVFSPIKINTNETKCLKLVDENKHLSYEANDEELLNDVSYMKEKSTRASKVIRFNYLGDFSYEGVNLSLNDVLGNVESSFFQTNQTDAYLELNIIKMGDKLQLFTSYDETYLNKLFVKNILFDMEKELKKMIEEFKKLSEEIGDISIDLSDISLDEIQNIFE